jgi:hypothetical protein
MRDSFRTFGNHYQKSFEDDNDVAQQGAPANPAGPLSLQTRHFDRRVAEFPPLGILMNNVSPGVGLLLANQVASALEAGGILAYSHRDYCGIGLRFVDQVFVYGKVYDGKLPSPKEVAHLQEGGNLEQRVFGSKEEFVQWLAGQTDESLSGKDLKQEWLQNNQRLSISRLKTFVEECEILLYPFVTSLRLTIPSRRTAYKLMIRAPRKD